MGGKNFDQVCNMPPVAPPAFVGPRFFRIWLTDPLSWRACAKDAERMLTLSLHIAGGFQEALGYCGQDGEVRA